MARGWFRITPENRLRIIELSKQGLSFNEIGRRVGHTEKGVRGVLRPFGGVVRRDVIWNPSSARLSLDERIKIKLGLERGHSCRVIARALGRDHSTVSREVNRHGGKKAYAPAKAHEAAFHAARRPKITKLAANPRLWAKVISDLEELWSPQQISARLRTQFGDDASMRISHETIYKSIYVQGRGELRKELAKCLRTGRARRVSQNRLDKRGKIPDMINISERPAEANDRAVPGHWEGDLLLGKAGKSAIGTLVERATRYVMLFPLPNGATAEEVRKAMTKTIQSLPESLKRTLTWDQGREMSHHMQFKIDTGVDVFFCDPHSPWQRGSNENTNGLLRQYFPKGTDLSKYTPKQIRAAADSLNGRPRMTLDWRTPAEALAEFVAFTG